MPELVEGDSLPVKDYKPEQHFTQAPPRFTEASLVKTLEEEGIGRPSTYAPIISTIISRGYVERDGKQLVPTELGFIVVDLLSEYFPDVTDVEFTAQLEKGWIVSKRLRLTGKRSWLIFIILLQIGLRKPEKRWKE